jgi:hypothetical protein
MATTKSHSERMAEHGQAMAALGKTRDVAVGAAKGEIAKAETAYTHAAKDAEDQHAASLRLELKLSRQRAIETLVRAIKPWRRAPNREDTQKIIKAWNEADADAKHATGAGLHPHVIAFAFAETMIAEDPDAVLAFATPGIGIFAQLLSAGAGNASKLLAASNTVEAHAALEQLERVVNTVARQCSRMADVGTASDRWAVMTLCTHAELEEFDVAWEQERQRVLSAGIKPLRRHHPVDYAGAIVQTPDVRTRIAAGAADGKPEHEVLSELMAENAASRAGPGTGSAVI